MSYLLDTQIALWIFSDSERLPLQVKKLLARTDGDWIFSQVSTWEIQIKYSLGKLELPGPPAEVLPRAIKESNFQYASISDEAIFLLGTLPPLHRDPFDRLLVAQAIVGGHYLVTTDKAIASYPVKVVGQPIATENYMTR